MSEPVSTIDGWYSLHLLYSVDWAGLRVLDKDERNALTEELQTFLTDRKKCMKNTKVTMHFTTSWVIRQILYSGCCARLRTS